MGLMIDTNVFINFERSHTPVDLSIWEPGSKVYISVVTVTELLIGVHRADTEERRRLRSVFVEAVLARVGILELTVGVARVHAELYADLARRGRMIGAHDLIIAATAKYHGISLLTEDVEEFSHVSDLRVIPFKTTA